MNDSANLLNSPITDHSKFVLGNQILFNIDYIRADY